MRRIETHSSKVSVRKKEEKYVLVTQKQYRKRLRRQNEGKKVAWVTEINLDLC